MTMIRDFANGTGWTEDLLRERRYKDWFWDGLQDGGRTLRVDPNPKIICRYCRVPKFRSEFSLNDHPTIRRCNLCILTRQNLYSPYRWLRAGSLKWREKATCQGVDVSVFFPEDSQGRLTSSGWRHPRARWRIYCSVCPVMAECEAFARASKSTGIFGGKLFILRGNTLTVYEDTSTNSAAPGRPRKERTFPYKCRGRTEKHLIESEEDIYADGACRKCDRSRSSKHRKRQDAGGPSTHIP